MVRFEAGVNVRLPWPVALRHRIDTLPATSDTPPAGNNEGRESLVTRDREDRPMQILWQPLVLGVALFALVLVPRTGLSNALSGSFSATSGQAPASLGSFTLFDNDFYGVIADASAHFDYCNGIDRAQLRMLHLHPSAGNMQPWSCTDLGTVPGDVATVGLRINGGSPPPVDGAMSFSGGVSMDLATAGGAACDNGNSHASGAFTLFGVMTDGRPITLPYSATVTRANMFTTLLPVDFAVLEGERIHVHIELPAWSTFGMNPGSVPWLAYDVLPGPEQLAYTSDVPYLRNPSYNAAGEMVIDAYYLAAKDTIFHLVPTGLEGYSSQTPADPVVPDELMRYTVTCINCDRLVALPMAGNPDGGLLTYESDLSDFVGPALSAQILNQGASVATVTSIPFLVASLSTEKARLTMDVGCDGVDLATAEVGVSGGGGVVFEGLDVAIPAGGSLCLSLVCETAHEDCGCSAIEATLLVDDIDVSYPSGVTYVEGANIVGSGVTEPPTAAPIVASVVTDVPGSTVPVGVQLPSFLASSCPVQMSARFAICATPAGGEAATFADGSQELVVDFDSNSEAPADLVVPPAVLGDYKVCVDIIENAGETSRICPADPDGPLEIVAHIVADFCEGHPDGDPCDDHDPCTQGETCLNEVCKGGSPKDCGPTPPCRLTWSCNPANGQCEGEEAEDGFDCEDDDLCSTGSTCHQGACVADEYLVCTPPNECYTVGPCVQDSGTCPAPQPREDGAECHLQNGDAGVCACKEHDTRSGNCSVTECVPETPVPDAGPDVSGDDPGVPDAGPGLPDAGSDEPDAATGGPDAATGGDSGVTGGGGGGSCQAGQGPAVAWPILLPAILPVLRRRTAVRAP